MNLQVKMMECFVVVTSTIGLIVTAAYLLATIGGLK